MTVQARLRPGKYRLTVEDYLRLAADGTFGDTMPEPDLVVALDHRDGVLPAEKVRLMVEVSDSTLTTDLGTKARLYATHGVPEYWVADVNGRVVQQSWSPAHGAYRERREVAFGQPLTAATIAGLTVPTAGL
jgi:Uma2 family endonuclease